MQTKSVLSRVIISLLVIAGAGLWLREIVRVRSAAGRERTTQVQELADCEKNLKAIHAAWKRYQTAHKGGEPQDLASLFPKYLKKPEILLCPTAKRWQENRRPLEQGTFKYKDKDYPATYGLRWLTTSYGMQKARYGESAAVVTCLSHREAMYRAVYNKRPPLDAYDEGNRAGLASEITTTPLLAVRRNGEIAPLKLDEE